MVDIHLVYWSSVGEWLGYSLAVLGVDGSNLLTASQICDGLKIKLPLCLTVRFHSLGWIKVGTFSTLRPGFGNSE